MRPIMFLLFLGVSCTRSVPLTNLPEIVLGLYEAIPESEDSHFDELTHIFHLAVAVNERDRSLAGFHKQGDSFRQYFISADHLYSAYIPFKLDGKQNKTINGRVVEYEFTAEGDNHGATIRAAFREINGSRKFDVVAIFDSNGYNATYTRGESVARRSYRRILPGYVFGAFEPDLSQSSPNIIDFYNNLFSPPKGFSWSKDSKFHLERFDDKFCETAIVDPMSTLYYKTEFHLNRKQTVTHGNQTVESKHEIMNSTPNSTTVRITTKSAKGTFVNTCVHDRAGFTCTIVTDKGEVKSRYSRVMPWFFYGKFEEVPAMTENYEKFLEDGSKHTDFICPGQHLWVMVGFLYLSAFFEVAL
ncbi:uncharacterized protein LOC129584683 [Paramacrobiotus metropolitanus]|uniref:uncharacterized protein LOC129584683 n=1 Tax=Paramacrobiotus metropolitanus TaxID=2943436 RepID=UPI002445CAA5|nr:uncharacterized protein LOC129584683 [Paramacrobiotus metropolitanus]